MGVGYGRKARREKEQLFSFPCLLMHELENNETFRKPAFSHLPAFFLSVQVEELDGVAGHELVLVLLRDPGSGKTVRQHGP